MAKMKMKKEKNHSESALCLCDGCDFIFIVVFFLRKFVENKTKRK